jgi:hypothetical protein
VDSLLLVPFTEIDDKRLTRVLPNCPSFSNRTSGPLEFEIEACDCDTHDNPSPWYVCASLPFSELNVTNIAQVFILGVNFGEQKLVKVSP